MRYDLIIKGGTLIDPAQGTHGRRDVAIANGTVALVAESIPADQARRVEDASGLIVTPGLIDLHTHVYPKATDLGVNADDVCLAGGVTTSVDAGSAGSISFPGLRDYVLPTVRSRVYAYVHLSSIGLINSAIGELINMDYLDPDGAARTAIENPDLCLGIKVRMAKHRVGGYTLKPLELAIEAAERAKCGVMVHITSPAWSLTEMFDLLRPGDVITHLLHGRDETVVKDGKVIDALWRAQERGVGTDVGHGNGSFEVNVARAAIADGFRPSSISTDVHIRAAQPPRHLMMTQVMSKMLALGMTLDEVIAASTINPARTIKKDHLIGTLAPGMAGDVTVLRLAEGDIAFRDSERQEFSGTQLLRPVFTVLGGEVVWAPEETPAATTTPAGS